MALFRALQEGLSNVLRHAGARTVAIGLSVHSSGVRLVVRDDGRGVPDTSHDRLEHEGHMGLAGMRERISALGGSVRFGPGTETGAALEVVVPLPPAAGS